MQHAGTRGMGGWGLGVGLGVGGGSHRRRGVWVLKICSISNS